MRERRTAKRSPAASDLYVDDYYGRARDEVFGSSGCEILFRRIADARGEIAIGVRRAGQERTPHGGVELNPRRDEPLQLNEDDELIALTTDK